MRRIVCFVAVLAALSLLSARAQDGAGSAGIGILYQDTPSHIGFRVVTVDEGSPAQQAGLRVGDVIRAIDGRNASDIYYYEVYNLLHGPLNSSVNLTIQRGTEPSRVVEVVRGPNQLSGIGAPARDIDAPGPGPAASPPAAPAHVVHDISDPFRGKPAGWVHLDILVPGEVPGHSVSSFKVGDTGVFHVRGRRKTGEWFDADGLVKWSTDARCVVIKRQDGGGCHVDAVAVGSGRMRATLTSNPRDAAQREFSVEKP